MVIQPSQTHSQYIYENIFPRCQSSVGYLAIMVHVSVREPDSVQKPPGPWFNIKVSSYQYRKSHFGDKTILRSSYLHNGISYTGKMISLYWIGASGQECPMQSSGHIIGILIWWRVDISTDLLKQKCYNWIYWTTPNLKYRTAHCTPSWPQGKADASSTSSGN